MLLCYFKSPWVASAGTTVICTIFCYCDMIIMLLCYYVFMFSVKLRKQEANCFRTFASLRFASFYEIELFRFLRISWRISTSFLRIYLIGRAYTRINERINVLLSC